MTRHSLHELGKIAVLAAATLALDGLAERPACLAQTADFAIGLSGGDALAFTWEFDDPERRQDAYVATAGYSIRDEDAWEFRWMYQRTVHAFVRAFDRRTEIYWGAGLRVKLESDTLYGVRTAAGVNFIPRDRQFSPEIFLEIAPTHDLSGEKRFSIGLAAGLRWRL